MLGLCRLLLRNGHEAEDAVQQTFLAAYRSLLSGTEPRHPAAWLATIARNECWALISKRMREPITETEPAGTLPDPVAAAAARADLAELWRAIGELPRQQRQALLLREFSGLSYDELAEALAVSEPAVESLLFRARRQLRVRLRPVHGSAASVAPLTAIREALARAIGGLPDPSAAGVLAKIASGPLVAKLAAGAAAVVVAGGTVAAVETGVVATNVGPGSADAATTPARPSAQARTRAMPAVRLLVRPRRAARAPGVAALREAPSTAALAPTSAAASPGAAGVGSEAPAGGTDAPSTAPAATPPPGGDQPAGGDDATGSAGKPGNDSGSGDEGSDGDDPGSGSGGSEGEGSGSSGSGSGGDAADDGDNSGSVENSGGGGDDENPQGAETDNSGSGGGDDNSGSGGDNDDSTSSGSGGDDGESGGGDDGDDSGPG